MSWMLLSPTGAWVRLRATAAWTHRAAVRLQTLCCARSWVPRWRHIWLTPGSLHRLPGLQASKNISD